MKIWRGTIALLLLLMLQLLVSCGYLGLGDSQAQEERRLYEERIRVFREQQEELQRQQEEYNRNVQESLQKWAEEYGKWQEQQQELEIQALGQGSAPAVIQSDNQS